MRVRPGVELASLSDVGCQRQNNEDRYSYWEPANDQEFPVKGRLAIVADGMGGYEGGQEASRIAVEAIEEVYAQRRSRKPAKLASGGFPGGTPSHPAICRQVSRFAGDGDDLHRHGLARSPAVLLARRRQPPVLGARLRDLTSYARPLLRQPFSREWRPARRRGRISSPAPYPDRRSGSRRQRYVPIVRQNPWPSNPAMCFCCVPMVCGAWSPKPKFKPQLPARLQLKSAIILSIAQKGAAARTTSPCRSCASTSVSS